MKILVTGGNGFIGSHVVDLLRQQDHAVTIFDRYRKPFRDDIEQFAADIKDGEAVFDAVSQHDAVINLAGILGTSETVSSPHESVAVNINGAINVYEAVRKFGKRCVQITVGNYTWNNSYAITKSTAERFGLMYNKEYGTKIVVVRGLNVYGPRQKHAPVRKVVPNFVLRALRNEPIEIYGDGKQLLDLIYVGDTAEILVRALLKDHDVYDHVIEAGSGNLVTANELAQTVIEAAKSQSKLVHLPMRPGEPVRSVTKGDPSTLEPLDYLPETSLTDGIKQTVEWYREHYAWQDEPIAVSSSR